EVEVERPLRHIGRLEDVGERGACEAAARKGRGRRAHDVLACDPRAFLLRHGRHLLVLAGRRRGSAALVREHLKLSRARHPRLLRTSRALLVDSSSISTITYRPLVYL